MTIHTILIAPHPILRKKATPVHTFDSDLHTLIEDMFETMYNAPGIGLAAPQIGISKRILVMDCAETPSTHELAQPIPNQVVMINPVVINKTGKKESYDEGCLSLPNYEIAVDREYSATIQYQDTKGQKHTTTFEGLPARCALHEIDHLNGILIVDYTSQLKRSRILRELRIYKVNPAAIT